VIVKPLVDGSAAVALFNDGARPADIATDTAAVGLPAAPCYTVRDLWSHTDAPTTGAIARPAIPRHAVVMLRVSASCG
jgi:alpha-galactosidase